VIANLAAIGTVALLGIAIWQLNDLRDQRMNRTVQSLMLTDQQLTQGASVPIRHAIERGGWVLKQNGGQYSEEDLGDFLDVFDGLAFAFERGLIDLEWIYIWHSYSIMKAYRNAEAVEYIKKAQMENPVFYESFQKLALLMIELDKRQPRRVPTLRAPSGLKPRTGDTR